MIRLCPWIPQPLCKRANLAFTFAWRDLQERLGRRCWPGAVLTPTPETLHATGEKDPAFSLEIRVRARSRSAESVQRAWNTTKGAKCLADLAGHQR